MKSATTEIGIRDLRNHLSRYVDEVREGAEVIVTDRGKPVARLTSLDERSSRLQDLIDQGLVRPPKDDSAYVPTPVRTAGPVSDLIRDQRP